MLRRTDAAEQRVERALDGGPTPHDAAARRMLAAAGSLAPSHSRRNPARVQQTHDAMLAAFRRTLEPLASREDAGTGDGLEESDLHRTEVPLCDGTQLVVSDLEEITPDRLDALREILASRTRNHQS
ncbi:hypothetical protein ACIQU7_23430 [Streptomyces albidoflavus]